MMLLSNVSYGGMLMNKKRLFVYLIICLVFFLFLVVTSYDNKVLEIEEKNQYTWQKYMNEDEYNQLQKDMSYIDVVRIVGGAGKEIKSDVYEWNDEILLTRGYQIQFENDRLVKKEIKERRGNSMR